jgi:hypothetical protein
MKFIAFKTSNGSIKGKIALYCQVLKVSRQGFYYYIESLGKPWKYEALAAKMYEIINEDECNDTYGRYRMHNALEFKRDAEGGEFPYIPHERTVYRVMEKLGLVHTPKRKPNGLTKADREAMKSDDKLKRDFEADKPLEKCVTDITEVKTADGKLYISVVEDCFDNAILGLSMADNMRAGLCVETLKSAMMAYPGQYEADGIPTIVGGAVKGQVWSEILCSIMGRVCSVTRYPEEAASLGAAVIGSVGVGLFPDFSSASHLIKVEKEVQPNIADHAFYAKKAPLIDKLYHALEQYYNSI